MCTDVGIGPVLCGSIRSRSFQFAELRVATVLLCVPARLFGLRLRIDASLLLLELLLPTKLILVRDLCLVHDADLQVILILVPLEEAVLHVLSLVAEDLVQADVFHRAEDVPLDVRIRFLQLLDQLFRL